MIPPKKFTYKPFDPIALDSSADFAGYRYAQPGPFCAPRKYNYDKYIILKFATIFGQVKKFRSLQNSVGLFKGKPQKTSTL
jgi:hypothetical protein